MSSMSKNKSIAIGVGLAAVTIGGALTYFLTRSKKSDDYSKNEIPSRKNSTSSFVRNPKYKEQLDILKAIMEKEGNEKSYSIKAVYEITRTLAILIKDSYIEISEKCKKRRIPLLNNIVEWCKEEQKESGEFDALSEEGLEQLCKDIGIDKKRVEKEIESAMERDIRFATASHQIFESLKIGARTKAKPISKELMLNILDFQIEKSKEISISEFTGPTFDDKLEQKASYVGDLTAYKFDIDESDIINNISFLSDVDVIEKQRALQAVLFEEKEKVESMA